MKNTMTIQEQYDYIVENGITTEEALQLVVNINGLNQETINDVIFACTGYRGIKQLESANQ